MSELSEALERQLRKLIPPPPAPAPKAPGLRVGKTVVNTAKSISLGYQEGSSDKVYHVQIVEVTGGFEVGFEVHFQYGRRGKTLIHGTKTTHPVSENKALGIYWDLVNQKQAKGYKEI